LGIALSLVNPKEPSVNFRLSLDVVCGRPGKKKMSSSKFGIWKEEYSVGIPVIDEQHKIILEEINQLYDVVEKEDLLKTLKRAFVVLEEFEMTHFRTEEELMTKMNFPKLREHKEHHEQFKKKIREIVFEYESGSLMQFAVLLDFLKTWWENHIIMEDKQYAEYGKTISL
jgi:hemerythrin